MSPPFDWIAFGFCLFEGQKNASPDCRGVLERFQPRRESGPVGMAEIRMARTGGYDNDARAVRIRTKAHLSLDGINRADVPQKHGRVLLMAKIERIGAAICAGDSAAAAT